MKRALLVVFLAASAWRCGSHGVQHAVSDLEVTPASLDFGTQPAGLKTQFSVSLNNAGEESLSLAGSAIQGDTRGAFGLINNLPSSIAPGSTFALQVAYLAPNTAGADVATLTFTSSAQNAPTVSIALSGKSTLSETNDGGFDGGCTEAVPAGCVDRWIAFDSTRDQGNRDIYALRPDGTQVQRLTNDLSNENPAFSWDGKLLAFDSDRSGIAQIYSLDLKTGAETQVTQASTSSTEPAWSPDGTQLAFHRGASVFVIHVDGTGELELAQGLDDINGYEYPSFTPNGDWIVMDRLSEVDAVQPDGGGFRNIVPSTDDTQETPAISPSGAEIAFATYCVQGGSEGIYTAPVGGITQYACQGGAHLVTPGRRPSWGPGFVAYEVPGASVADIWVTPASGGQVFNLTQGAGDNRNPAWAPAGTVLP